MKGETDKNFEKLNHSISSLWRHLQTASVNGAASLLSTPPGRSLDSTGKVISRSVHDLKSKAETTILAAVSVAVEEFNTLRRNIERNVETLRSGGGGRGTSDVQTRTAAISNAVPTFPTSTRDILAGVVSPGLDDRTAASQSLSLPSSSSPPASTPSTFPEEVFEEDPRRDLSSVSATSVFSIGYLGPPLLGPQESDGFTFSNDVAPVLSVDADKESGLPASVVRLGEARRAIGKALTVYKRIRGLGISESSWENKMPWRNPRPASLAKGLKWPQQKFSSVRERRQYHRRARRRGRYLIGAIPGWSWFAADVLLLYFLINNPAGNFLI